MFNYVNQLLLILGKFPLALGSINEGVYLIKRFGSLLLGVNN